MAQLTAPKEGTEAAHLHPLAPAGFPAQLLVVCTWKLKSNTKGSVLAFRTQCPKQQQQQQQQQGGKWEANGEADSPATCTSRPHSSAS